MDHGGRKLLASFTTDYCRYEVVDLMYNERPARVLFAGTSQSAQSGIALDEDTRMLFDYNEYFMELIARAHVRSVLVLGGGVFTFPSAVKRRWPHTDLVAVERDEALGRVARQFFGLTTLSGYKVVYDDVRQYLERLDRVFDAIIVDVYDEEEVPADVADVSATALLARACSRDGFVACNLIGALHGFGSSAVSRRKALFGRSFGMVDINPATTGASGWGSQNLVLVARQPLIANLE